MSKNLYVSALLDVYGSFLSEKQRLLCEYYFNDDLSLSEISENEGITRQAVQDSIKRAEASLSALEEKCRYCERFLRLKALAPEARNGKTESINEILDIIENL